ncbi:hypothetical protein K435DRAFT_583641, partial [Dendrothele bispora CBS 962.96]
METYLHNSVYGDLWEDAVNVLVSLESVYGFQTSHKSLSRTSRPPAVKHWVEGGRKQAIPTVIQGTKPDAFEPEVVGWWNQLQPDWRTLAAGSTELEGGKWTREVKGDWKALRQPGINGLYSVLACMKWWLLLQHKDLDEVDANKASFAWDFVLKDIVWVIDSM